MFTILLILHVIVSALLVAIVLLQVGRGRGMLGFLGGGAAESLFGSRAGDVLTKATAVVAALFMITSLSLAYLAVKKGGTVMKGIPRLGTKSPAEVAPGAAAEDKLVQKGTDLVKTGKEKLMKLIPRLTKTEEKEEAPEVSAEGLAATETTKSKISYDAQGNKIVDELKYDASGKLIGHKKITYDRFDRKLDEEELPLEEGEPTKE